MARNSSRRAGGRLPEETDPRSPLEDWDVKDAILEMQAAVADAAWFCKTIDVAERTRLCWWTNKDASGRKVSRGSYKAQPWENAADHEVHLAQEIIDERTAMRVAAIMRGALCVNPTDGTRARAAAQMKLVLRYFLGTAMRNMVPLHGLRAGSWSDRHGHSIVYVGWREERAVEKRRTSVRELAGLLAGAADAETGRPGGGEIVVQTEEELMGMVLDPAKEEVLAGLLLASDPGLMARGKEGAKEARRAIAEARRMPNGEIEYHSSFVKYSAPIWETLVPFVDVFYPAESEFEPNLESARWIARVKWLSAQQLREQGALNGWDEDWVDEVIEKCRGKASAFDQYMQQVPWVLSGIGVRWVSTAAGSGVQTTSEAQRNLFQIVEMYDRSTTPDGLTGTYKTVLHADIKDKVAKRELLEHWDGCYPFVPFVCEKDEKMLLASRGVPERVKSPQSAIKAQWDSRTDMAAMTTLPPWTGPDEMRGTRIHPGMFVPESRFNGKVGPMSFPPPDGRSIEIEATIRRGVDRQFGRMSNEVPEALSMLMGQSDMDWFLMSFSQAVALTAKLVQQFMRPLVKARILGTEIDVTADREDVRGAFDFAVKFDVRSLDIEWAKELLTFVKDLIIPLDRRAQVDTTPALEFGFNILDPALAAQSIKPVEEASADEAQNERLALSEIFSGGGPMVTEGMDYGTRAEVMVQEYKKSPLRQQAVMSNGQIRTVFTSRLKQLLANVEQHEVNPWVGRTLGEPPLKEPSEAERLLEFLEAVPEPQAAGAA